MRIFFFTLFLVAIFFGSPRIALANSFIDLQAQLDAILKQALEIRLQVKQMAFEQPVQATLASVNQKQVALQVGHWKLENVPWELQNLDPYRQAQGGGKFEWEVNLRIAEETKKLLEEQGIGVTILPAILPSTYKADVFVAIHADQNPSAPWLSGFKVAASAFDKSGQAAKLQSLLSQEYRTATWLNQESYIPLSMPYYYAFNIDRFIYAVHPETPAVIIETGYLLNPRDRAVILTNPQMSAAGIAKGIIRFFEEQDEKAYSK